MKSYILEHINELENFCTQNNITVENILNSPKSFNKNTMYILRQDSKAGENGLNNEVTAEVLLIIQRKENKLEFLPKPNLKKYLS